MDIYVTRYQTVVSRKGIVEFDVSFIASADNGEGIGDIQRKLGEWLAGGHIQFVKSDKDNTPRCFYCGVKHSINDSHCGSCGVAL